jgi:hypothetical protein
MNNLCSLGVIGKYLSFLYSAILSDMNNLCSLGVIGKYLSFLYATRVFPLPTYHALGQLNIFKVV